MKLTLLEVHIITMALHELLTEINQSKADARLIYGLNKNLKALAPEYQSIQESVKAISEEHAPETEEYKKRVEELGREHAEVNLYKIKLDYFSGVSTRSDIMTALDKIIQE